MNDGRTIKIPNKIMQDLLLNILSVALGNSSDNIDYSGVDWRKLHDLSKMHAVNLLVWDTLKNKPEVYDNIEKKIRHRFIASCDSAESKYLKHRRVIAKLAEFYSEHGIDMIVLKGYGMSLNYPVPNHRHTGDIDIWLFGKLMEGNRLLHEEKGVEIETNHHHHTVFYVNDVKVENHFDFVNIYSRKSNRIVEKRLHEIVDSQKCEEIDVEGQRVFLPPADFNALFLLRHTAIHFVKSEAVLRHVIDWGTFVAKYHDSIDWTGLYELSRELNMHRFLNCLNAICIDSLGFDRSFFPEFERDAALEKRVLNDIIEPEFDRPVPEKRISYILWKLRQFQASRWKERIVYSEGTVVSFFDMIRNHFMDREKTVH